MIICSFDVGFTCGICRYDTVSDTFDLWSVPLEDIYKFIFYPICKSDVAIVERMPKYNTQSSIQTALTFISGIFSERKCPQIEIAPSTWKPIAKKRKWKAEEAKTDHEQDAYCLCKYFIEFYKERYE